MFHSYVTVYQRIDGFIMVFHFEKLTITTPCDFHTYPRSAVAKSKSHGDLWKEMAQSGRLLEVTQFTN